MQLSVDYTYIIGWVIAILLLIFASIISGAEAAIVLISADQEQNIGDSDSKKTKCVNKILNYPERYYYTILISKLLYFIPSVILATYLCLPIFWEMESQLLLLIIQFIAIPFVFLLIYEYISKSIASKFPLSYIYASAWFVRFNNFIFRPLVLLFIRTMGTDGAQLLAKRKTNLSIDDLSQVIELASDELNDEKEMLEGIINFQNIEVTAIMQPRNEIVALDFDWDLDKMLSVVIESGYSRLPVYKENNDNIVGVIYIKDLIPYLEANTEELKWQNLIRSILFVPEEKNIKDLLKEFQTKKMHIATVIDEYGGTSGLVTMEDILEEIVGEITDESDNEILPYQQIGENVWEFEGSTALTDFCKVFDIDYSDFAETKGENDTIAGLILEISEDMPKKFQRINYGNFVFTILDADNRRITRIKVKRDEVE